MVPRQEVVVQNEVEDVVESIAVEEALAPLVLLLCLCLLCLVIISKAEARCVRSYLRSMEKMQVT